MAIPPLLPEKAPPPTIESRISALEVAMANLPDVISKQLASMLDIRDEKLGSVATQLMLIADTQRSLSQEVSERISNENNRIDAIGERLTLVERAEGELRGNVTLAVRQSTTATEALQKANDAISRLDSKFESLLGRLFGDETTLPEDSLTSLVKSSITLATSNSQSLKDLAKEVEAITQSLNPVVMELREKVEAHDAFIERRKKIEVFFKKWVINTFKAVVGKWWVWAATGIGALLAIVASSH